MCKSETEVAPEFEVGKAETAEQPSGDKADKAVIRKKYGKELKKVTAPETAKGRWISRDEAPLQVHRGEY